MSGTNKIEGSVSFPLSASIGVSPDPDPFNIQQETYNDLSQLTIDGVIGGGQLTKTGFGELVLTAINTYGVADGTFAAPTYNTIINQGWITVENNHALGTIPNLVGGINSVDAPGVQVLSGASLMLKQDLQGNNLNLTYPMNLAGLGIFHRFPWLNQMGALVNLDGANLLTGDIYLTGQTGIGVEPDGANAPYLNPTQLIIQSTIHDGFNGPGELVKLGTQRLILQGQGLYTGGVDIRTGVIRIQNDTALGSGSTTAAVINPNTGLGYTGGTTTSNIVNIPATGIPVTFGRRRRRPTPSWAPVAPS